MKISEQRFAKDHLPWWVFFKTGCTLKQIFVIQGTASELLLLYWYFLMLKFEQETLGVLYTT